MGSLKYFNGKDHSLMVQGINNTKSKEKKIVKEKKPKSKIEDKSLKPIDEDSVKKVKKKGITSKCYYFKNKFFNKNMQIMSQLLEKHNIKVLDELEKPFDSS